MFQGLGRLTRAALLALAFPAPLALEKPRVAQTMNSKISEPQFLQRPIHGDALADGAPSRPFSRGNFWGAGPIRFADMFCGIGGFHVAATDLGLECVFACDIDRDCRRAYEQNFGLAPQSDICQVDPAHVPDHEILCAGFPCQPFSIIGNREGFDDARGTLFFELARVIEAKQPKALVLENVRQLATHNKGATLRRILEILRALGYQVDYRILNALDFGLPQKRERILIVGFKGSASGFEWPGETAPMRPLREVLETNPHRRHFVSAHIRRARRVKHKSAISPAIWHENKSGNVSSHPFSCALRAGASYNYLLVDGKRRLTPREMLRLQGFPDSFAIVCNDTQTRRQAGNSVPVPVVKAVLARVLKANRAAS